MNRPQARLIRHGFRARFPLDHLPLTPFHFPILPDRPCPPSLSLTPTSPQTGRDVSLQKVALTTSITQPALPPGSILVDRAPSPLALSPPPLLHPHRPPLQPRLSQPPYPPLPLQRLLLTSPSPKAGKSVKLPMAAHTLSTTTAERLHGSTLVSQTRPQLFSLPLPLRAP